MLFLGFFGVTSGTAPLRNKRFFPKVMCKKIYNQVLVFPSFIGSEEVSGMPRSK